MSELIKTSGTVIKQIAGFYYVDAGDAVYECRAKGKFRNLNETPLPGDTVDIMAAAGVTGRVESIHPRKNFFIRPAVANVDRVYIVASVIEPAPNALVMDRLAAIAEFKGVEPIFVFNKSDIASADEWAAIYKNAGFETYVVSAATGEGVEELRRSIKGCFSVFTGNSGVGKSSLLNHIFPEAELATGEISNKLGRGRHTTRTVELLKTEGGYIADTPGFSSLTFEQEDILKDDLAECFREFADHIGDCRFTSCTHTAEKGCAVLEAVREGKISESRHLSYKTFYEELKSVKEWERKKKSEQV